MGFWHSLFKSRPVSIAAVNKAAFPHVESSRQVVDNSDYSEEYASELYTDPGENTDNSYSENGVFLKEATDIFRLTYDGILARDGASDVYAVIGLEDNSTWKDIKYYPMQKTRGQAFEVLFPAQARNSINVAFKDGADHWDNNSGKNYKYE